MNKRIIAILAILILTMGLLCSCGGGDTSPTDAEIAQKEAPAAPKKPTSEEAYNTLGRRFTYTLEELTVRIDKGLKAQGYATTSKGGNGWVLLSDGLVDDAGCAYSSYYMEYMGLTLTAAVEKDSSKVINIGCCYTTYPKDAPYPSVVAGVIACAAGGFSQDDEGYFSYLFLDLIKSGGEGEKNAASSCYCEGIACTGNTTDDAVLLMVEPCTAEYAEENEIPTYRMQYHILSPKKQTETEKTGDQ